MRELADPAKRLGDATGRYHDALYVAAEDLTGPEVAAGLDVAARALDPAPVDQRVWPALRADLPQPGGGTGGRGSPSRRFCLTPGLVGS